jgi:hypothetical protein
VERKSVGMGTHGGKGKKQWLRSLNMGNLYTFP